MFFIVFRFIQLQTEKESTIQELIEKFKVSKEVFEKKEEIIEEKELNIDDLIHKIIPQSPQSFTLNKFSDNILANIAKVSELVQGLVYVKSKENGEFKPTGKYAYYSSEPPKSFFEGDTITGQVAKNKKILNINNVPENYFTVISGLGKGSPKNLLILPILEKEDTIAVIEMATFKAFDKEYEKMFGKLAALLGKIIVKLK